MRNNDGPLLRAKQSVQIVHKARALLVCLPCSSRCGRWDAGRAALQGGPKGISCHYVTCQICMYQEVGLVGENISKRTLHALARPNVDHLHSQTRDGCKQRDHRRDPCHLAEVTRCSITDHRSSAPHLRCAAACSMILQGTQYSATSPLRTKPSSA